MSIVEDPRMKKMRVELDPMYRKLRQVVFKWHCEKLRTACFVHDVVMIVAKHTSRHKVSINVDRSRFLRLQQNCEKRGGT